MFLRAFFVPVETNSADMIPGIIYDIYGKCLTLIFKTLAALKLPSSIMSHFAGISDIIRI